MDVFSGDVRSGMPGLHGGGQERSRSLSAARPSWYPTTCSLRATPGRRSGAPCWETATAQTRTCWPPAYSTPKGSRPTCRSSSEGSERGGSPRELWIYDLRTNQHFTLKANSLERHHLDDFVACYNTGDRSQRAAGETEQFGWFTDDELVNRDKTNLDIFWLLAESLKFPEFTRRLSRQKESPAYPGSR